MCVYTYTYKTHTHTHIYNQFSSVTWECPTFFETPWTAACQASLSITNSLSLLKLSLVESVMPSNHLILCRPLHLPPSIFSSIRSFPVSQFFTSGGQSIGVPALASVLPMNIQDWFLLGWTGWICLQSKGLSRVLSNTTAQKHQFSGAQLSYSPTLTSAHPTTGKTISLARSFFFWYFVKSIVIDLYIYITYMFYICMCAIYIIIIP